MAGATVYEAKPHAPAGATERWGVYNLEADRWLDIHFATEPEAVRTARFLSQARVKLSATPEPRAGGAAA